MSEKLKAKRNDPCPCGSGKKFKKCCIPVYVPYVAPEPKEIELRKVQTGKALPSRAKMAVLQAVLLGLM